jgi:hypothetical protein
MNKNHVRANLDRVLTWPPEAPKEAVATLRAIEEEWSGGCDFHATPDELEAIDEADRGGAASVPVNRRPRAVVSAALKFG